MLQQLACPLAHAEAQGLEQQLDPGLNPIIVLARPLEPR